MRRIAEREGPWVIALAIAAGLSFAGCGCGGDDGPGDRDAGGGGSDTGMGGDSGMGGFDAGPIDADVPDPCKFMMCPPFETCVAGVCQPYPTCAGDGSCPDPADVCRARRCVPGTEDIDGDGVPAATDCDETNPMISPMEPEHCNGIDDNCDMMIDEGDPVALCMEDPSGGECVMGGCGCPMGRFDLDGMPGCECEAMPVTTQGASCADAIDLGDLHDTGMMSTQTSNVLPADRAVWYRFNAVAGPDGSCDAFRARV